MKATEEALHKGIEQSVAGQRIHDISHAVQEHVEAHGFSVVRDLVGHGVGLELHEEPSVPNFGKQGTGIKIQEGMTLAIEPMVNAGTWEVQFGADGWTVQTVSSGQAVLSKVRRMGWFWNTIGVLITAGFWLIYVIYRALNRKRDTLIITVDAYGQVRRQS